MKESDIKGYKPEVKVAGEPGWKRNGLVFPTYDQAEAAARDLMGRWTLVTDARAVACGEDPNYEFVNGRPVRIGNN